MEATSHGFAAHVAAEKAITKPLAHAEAQAAHAEAIDRARLTSTVRQLNNVAQSEIWGTAGRTDGYTDPATGVPLAAPIKGLVNEMREGPQYGEAGGESGAEREAKASAYEAEVQSLQDDGFELSQAKLVMDLRDRDRQLSTRMTAKKIMEGTPATEAESDVNALYAKKDAKRLQQIKEEGIFDAAGFVTKRAHRSSRTRRAPGAGGTDPSNAPTGVMPTGRHPDAEVAGWQENFPELASRTALAEKTRQEYIRGSTGRANRSYRFGTEFSEKAVAKSRQQYEERKAELLSHEIKMLEAGGFTKDELDEYAAGSAVLEAEKLTVESFSQRLIATGKWEMKDIHDDATGEDRRRLVKIEPPYMTTELIKNKFLKLWGKKDGDKLFSKPNLKTVAKRTAVAGAVPAAFAGTMLMPPLTLGIAGAYAAGKIAGGVANIKPGTRHKRNEHWIWDAVQENLREISEVITDQDEIASDLIDEQTEARIPANRRQLKIKLGATAVGGIAGGIGGAFVKPH